MFTAFLYPEISKIKNAKQILFHKSRKLIAQYYTLLWPQKYMKVILSEQLFVLYYCHRLALLLKFWNEKTNKLFLEYFTHHWKNSKMDP